MNMEEIRNNYEYGLMQQIDTLAFLLNKKKWSKIELREYYERIAGYLSAGLYSDIITADEYAALREEVYRWQYC